MTKTRNLSDLLDANGDVKLGNLDNVPASNDASALTTGTLPIARIADGDIALAKLSATGTKDATTFLRGDNTFAEAGGGKILQVVTATDSTQRSMTGTTFLTGSNTLSVNITPSATSSKIFLFSTFFVKVVGGTWGLYTIFRDSTNLSPISSTTSLTQVESTTTGGIGQSMSFLDSPNSTSELTYQVYMRAGGAGTVYLTSSAYGGTTSVLTAMEIGV